MTYYAPHQNSSSHSIGFQGLPAPDFIKYKTEEDEWICLYRTDTINESGRRLYAYQEGTIYTETSSGTHCFSILPPGEATLVTDDGFAIMTDRGSQIVRDIQEFVTDEREEISEISAETGDIIVNY